ncbi:hypothetical protein ALP45_200108 [Pseudomonas coronafaciens pv. atropurpurea]|nr:Uncharacterized protein ALO66_00487 [Pseudomonas coronafaciens pv. atropurpurea]RMT61920.1 hypothetical protein ALP45_200108 [Pseudomonas coronafaciens pv. atropurpurea]
MKRFIQGEHRGQSPLLPESLDDYVSETNPVRVVDVFVDELDLAKLGFDGVIPAETGRPAYHPAILLKIYIYGYLNRIQSSRRLEREAQAPIDHTENSLNHHSVNQNVVLYGKCSSVREQIYRTNFLIYLAHEAIAQRPTWT